MTDTDTGLFEPNNKPEISGFEIITGIGYGAMGVVWEAIQLSTKRRVALKLLANHLVHAAGVSRFRREIEVAAQLEHPGIARVYKSGHDRGCHYYCMEYVDGVPFNRYVDRNQLSTQQKAELFIKLCEAVAYAHRKGVVHRDLKPGNILVTGDGQPKILDFGLAKLMDAAGVEQLSMTHEVLGTPIYMSPEQAQGETKQIDARADVYGLGVILYDLMTGLYPHDVSGSNFDIMTRVIENEPIPPRKFNPKLDRYIEAILLKAVARKKEDRYDSAGDLLDDLRRYLTGQPVSARADTGFTSITRRLRPHRRRMATVGIIASAYVAAFLTIRWMTTTSTPAADPESGQVAQTTDAAPDSNPSVPESGPFQAMAEVDQWLELIDNEWNGQGQVIVGQLERHRFSQVFSHANVSADDSFSAAVYPGRTLWFYADGYEPIAVTNHTEIAPRVFDAGTLQFSRLADEDQFEIRRTVTLEGDPEDPPDINANIALQIESIDSDGYRSLLPIRQISVRAGDEFVLDNLFAHDYYLELSASDYVTKGTRLNPSSDSTAASMNNRLLKAPVLNFSYLSRGRRDDQEWQLLSELTQETLRFEVWRTFRIEERLFDDQVDIIPRLHVINGRIRMSPYVLGWSSRVYDQGGQPIELANWDELSYTTSVSSSSLHMDPGILFLLQALRGDVVYEALLQAHVIGPSGATLYRLLTQADSRKDEREHSLRMRDVGGEDFMDVALYDVTRWQAVINEEWSGEGIVLVGRVQAPSGTEVFTQARSFYRDGSFSTPVFPGRTLWFLANGYEPIAVTNYSRIGDNLFDAGTIEFRPIVTSRQRIVTGRVRREHPSHNTDSITLTLSHQDRPFIRSGYFPTYRIADVTVEDGEIFRFEHLPVHYQVLLVQAKGHVAQRHYISAGQGRLVDLNEIVLSPAPTINVDYIYRVRSNGGEWLVYDTVNTQSVRMEDHGDLHLAENLFQQGIGAWLMITHLRSALHVEGTMSQPAGDSRQWQRGLADLGSSSIPSDGFQGVTDTPSLATGWVPMHSGHLYLFDASSDELEFQALLYMRKENDE
jgi:serine/threonine protein kinase